MTKKELTPQEREQKRRDILFKPCKSQEHLRKWIIEFLDVDLPDCQVDPDSNCTPMSMVWEVYSKALQNNDPKFDRVLYYGSRAGYKTLSAAILEVLCILHLNRDVCHMAALEGQSMKAQEYVKKFLSRKTLRDFKLGDNLAKTEIVRYYDKDKKQNITRTDWEALTQPEQDKYEEIKRYIKIVVCTMRGANSDHTPIFVVDEIDVVADPRAYEQSKAIPDTVNGMMPISILTSTRKFAIGLVQQEIDNAIDEDGETKLHVRHWNAIDVTQKCPAERCLPDKPTIPIYVNEESYRAIGENQYNDLLDEDKTKYDKHEGFEGCLSNCKLFSVCKGRLYNIQTSKSKLLKPIDQTINQIRKFTPEMVTAELLCRKPSSTGLIYPLLERSIHMKTANQMVEMLLGYEPDHVVTKTELIKLIKQRGDWHFDSGMDFGFSHNFAVATGAADGYKCFVLDVISEPNLLPDRQVAVCNNRIKRWNPSIYADPENPQMVAVLRAAGFRMKKWIKGPGSLLGGVDAVRLKLREPLGEPTLFFLAGDPGVELLFKRMSSYHWKIDPQGNVSDVPDEKDDDECDALRYLIYNLFASKGGRAVHASTQLDKVQENQYIDPNVWTKENFYQKVLESHGALIGNQEGEFEGRDGSIIWSF